eukprot:7387154-Pyramimonas_sp.AAC.1
MKLPRIAADVIAGLASPIVKLDGGYDERLPIDRRANFAFLAGGPASAAADSDTDGGPAETDGEMPAAPWRGAAV